MGGEKNLDQLLKKFKPILNEGDYVFSSVNHIDSVDLNNIQFLFKEKENITIVIQKHIADQLKLKYHFVASWITLSVHSSLNAIGFTAAFSSALANEGISCNVVAAFYHDHIFVDKKDTDKAMEILNKLSKQSIGE